MKGCGPKQPPQVRFPGHFAREKFVHFLLCAAREEHSQQSRDEYGQVFS